MLNLRFDRGRTGFCERCERLGVARQIILSAPRKLNLRGRVLGRRTCQSRRDDFYMLFEIVSRLGNLFIATLCDERVQFLNARIGDRKLQLHLRRLIC